MHPFSRHKGKSLGKIEPCLGAEKGDRSDSGAIFLWFAFFKDQAKQVVVFFHAARQSSDNYRQGMEPLLIFLAQCRWIGNFNLENLK